MRKIAITKDREGVNIHFLNQDKTICLSHAEYKELKKEMREEKP